VAVPTNYGLRLDDEDRVQQRRIQAIRGPAPIDDGLGLTQQGRTLRLSHPEILFAYRVQECPFATKAETVQDRTNQREIPLSIRHRRLC